MTNITKEVYRFLLTGKITQLIDLRFYIKYELKNKLPKELDW